ncbi:MAG: 50S ribosomal protein L15 [Dehalococcoidales bacterium]
MVKQNNIAPATGSRHAAKRVGRGTGSGHGTFSGRGCKGQKARAGNNKVRPGFEGGQLPLIKRLPRKRGFVNIYKIEYNLVTLDDLNQFESGSEVTSEKMVAAGIITTPSNPIKVLADGAIDRPLTVKADKFSASAKAKIEAAGGKAEEV